MTTTIKESKKLFHGDDALVKIAPIGTIVTFSGFVIAFVMQLQNQLYLFHFNRGQVLFGLIFAGVSIVLFSFFLSLTKDYQRNDKLVYLTMCIFSAVLSALSFSDMILHNPNVGW